MVYLGRGVDNRRGSLACFIGVQPSCNTLLHGNQHGSHGAASHGPEAEGSGKYVREHARYLGDVGQDDKKPAHHIDKRHGGNQSLGHMGQTFKPAQGNHKDDKYKGDSCCEIGNAKILLHDAAYGVGLDEVASDNLGYHEEGAQHSQPGRVQSLFYVVHGTAHVISLFILFTVQHTQYDLAVFGSHSHKGSHPHPEDSSHAACQHGCGHTHNIAASHTGCHCRTQGLEGRYGSCFFGFLAF